MPTIIYCQITPIISLFLFQQSHYRITKITNILNYTLDLKVFVCLHFDSPSLIIFSLCSSPWIIWPFSSLFPIFLLSRSLNGHLNGLVAFRSGQRLVKPDPPAHETSYGWIWIYFLFFLVLGGSWFLWFWSGIYTTVLKII